MVTIAYERYNSVHSPFEKKQLRQRSLLFVTVCWLTATGLAALQLILAKPTITHDICNMSVEVYHSSLKYVVVAYGTGAFLIIVVYYIGILYLVKKHLHKFDQKVPSQQPRPSNSTNNGVTMLALKPPQRPTTLTPLATPDGDLPEADQQQGSTAAANNNPPEIEVLSPPIFGAVCERSEANRVKGKRKFEAEIAKRLFYIIASFLAIWMPYATLVVAITESNFLIKSKEVTFEVLFCLHILTTLAAALNPIIYMWPNGQFRARLRRFLWLNRSVAASSR